MTFVRQSQIADRRAPRQLLSLEVLSGQHSDRAYDTPHDRNGHPQCSWQHRIYSRFGRVWLGSLPNRRNPPSVSEAGEKSGIAYQACRARDDVVQTLVAIVARRGTDKRGIRIM